jgi:hypothetical protein
MQKERSEQRGYHRSPGRQYENDYEPLYSRREQSQHRYTTSNAGRDGYSSSRGASRPDTELLQRPDLRRTRQLMRQSIIASKRAANEEELTEPSDHSFLPTTSVLSPEEQDQDEWQEVRTDEPDPDYEETYVSEESMVYPKPPVSPEPPTRRRTAIPPRASGRRTRPIEPGYEDDYEDEEEPPRRRRRKKRKVSRRKLLVGFGIVAVGGAAIAAYEVAPRVPQALGDVGSGIERQLQDAFNKGVEQGANQVRREFVTALEELEGFTLQGAITAARLTRVAYDVFVSPIVQAGATITGNFLGALLAALKTGRAWLARIYQDNATLAALQTVIQNWVNEVSNMPKQLNAITQADLDGAQAYLRALQRKLDQEKALLNSQQPPSTPTANPSPKASPPSKK